MKRFAQAAVVICLLLVAGSAFASNIDSATNANYSVAGKVTTVWATASRALVNWSDFNVAQGSTVYFRFLNNSDTILNYVKSASTIDGTVGGKVNGVTGGNLIFWSPNGLTVGSTGYITAGSTTINTSANANPNEWLAGTQDLAFWGSKSDITVDGSIKGVRSVELDGNNVTFNQGSVIGVDSSISGAKLDSAKIHGDSLVSLGGTVTADNIIVEGSSIFITGKVRSGAKLALTATQDKIVETSTGSIYTKGLLSVTNLNSGKGIGTVVMASANNSFYKDPENITNICLKWTGSSFQQILIQDANTQISSNITNAKAGHTLTYPLNANDVKWSDASLNSITLR